MGSDRPTMLMASFRKTGFSATSTANLPKMRLCWQCDVTSTCLNSPSEWLQVQPNSASAVRRGDQLDVIDEILNTRNTPHCSLGWERQLGGGIAVKSDNTVFHAYRNRSKAKAAKSANAISDQIINLLAQFFVRNIWT